MVLELFQKVATRRSMAKTNSLKAWAAVIIVAVSTIPLSSAALAAPPDSVPNSGASNNCVATTSGILFYKQRDIRLGPYVKQFAIRGEQVQYVQGALATTC